MDCNMCTGTQPASYLFQEECPKYSAPFQKRCQICSSCCTHSASPQAPMPLESVACGLAQLQRTCRVVWKSYSELLRRRVLRFLAALPETVFIRHQPSLFLTHRQHIFNIRSWSFMKTLQELSSFPSTVAALKSLTDYQV